VVYSQADIYKGEPTASDTSSELSEAETAEVQEKLRGWGYAG
jgi:hypothetical protein